MLVSLGKLAHSEVTGSWSVRIPVALRSMLSETGHLVDATAGASADVADSTHTPLSPYLFDRETVVALQSFLQEKGYSCGGVDGILSCLTLDALVEWSRLDSDEA